MQTIEAKVRVGSDRTLSLQLPTDVPTGEYDVVLVLNQRTEDKSVPDMTALEEIRSILQQSIEPGHSLADELIEERRIAARDE
jgi:hypothetical protein